MKVTLTKEAMDYITMAEAKEARRIIKEMKDDTYIEEYAESAAVLAGGNDSYEILKADAKISKNSRVWNYYGDNTGNLDIWSVYDCTKDEIRSHMYVNSYQY